MEKMKAIGKYDDKVFNYIEPGDKVVVVGGRHKGEVLTVKGPNKLYADVVNFVGKRYGLRQDNIKKL